MIIHVFQNIVSGSKLIKSEKDIIRLINKIESFQAQQTKGIKSLKTKEPTPESLLKGEKYTDERGRTWDFGTKERPFPGWKPKVIQSKRSEFFKKYRLSVLTRIQLSFFQQTIFSPYTFALSKKRFL